VRRVTEPLNNAFTSLTPEERGSVLALYHMGKDAKLLAYSTTCSGERCGAALAALKAMPAGDRENWLAETTAQALSPVPEDISELHPSWIGEAIRGEPLPLIRAIADCLPDPARAAVNSVLLDHDRDETAMGATDLAPTLLADLARLLLLPLEPLCAPDVGPLAAELRRLPFDQLILRVMGLGAEILGRSLYGTPASLRAKMMATVGEPWAAVIGKFSMEKNTQADCVLAAVHAGAVLPPTAVRPEDRLFHVGLSRLKEQLTGEPGYGFFVVAGRLPYLLGRPWLGDAWRGW